MSATADLDADHPGVWSPARPTFHRRAVTSVPVWHREPEHCPEEGIGGSRWWVTYRGEAFGFVYSTWDRTGVHFRVRDMDRMWTLTDNDGEPLRFETRGAAVTHLLDLFGIDLDEPVDYDHHIGPRGGGSERLDRRF